MTARSDDCIATDCSSGIECALILKLFRVALLDDLHLSLEFGALSVPNNRKTQGGQ